MVRKKSQGGMGRKMLELSESCCSDQGDPKVKKDHKCWRGVVRGECWLYVIGFL